MESNRNRNQFAIICVMQTRVSCLRALIAALFIMLQNRGADASDLGLTIYNQNFAVVRDRVTLDLRQGYQPGSIHRGHGVS